MACKEHFGVYLDEKHSLCTSVITCHALVRGVEQIYAGMPEHRLDIQAVV